MRNTPPLPEHGTSFETLPAAERVMATILYHLRPLANRQEPDLQHLQLSYETIFTVFRPASPNEVPSEEQERIEHALAELREFADRWQSLQRRIDEILDEKRIFPANQRPTVLQLATAGESARTNIESLAYLADEGLYSEAALLQHEWDARRASIQSDYAAFTSRYGASFWISVAKHVSDTIAEEIPLDD